MAPLTCRFDTLWNNQKGGEYAWTRKKYWNSGIGGLGSYAVQYAKIMGGGSKVFVMDKSDNKLELASKCGADHLVNPQSTGNLVDRIRAETGGKMLDVIIDCVGTDKTLYDSMSILAK